jgi:hypothetical protein
VTDDDASTREWTPEAKKDVLRKYARGLEEIWKRLVDQGPPTGNPIELFQPAMELTEKTLEKILE